MKNMSRVLSVVIMGIVVLLSSTHLQAADFLKGPLMIYPNVSGKMAIFAQADGATSNVNIKWGEDTSYTTGNAAMTSYGTDNQYKYTIESLTPGTRYFYEVDIDGNKKSGSFCAALPDSSKSLTFYAVGDTRSNTDDVNTILGAMINDLNVSPETRETFWVHVGDWVSNGEKDKDWTDQWFNYSQPNIMEAMRRWPLVGVNGNHEGNSKLYRKYLPFAETVQSGTPANSNYYSFDDGPAHITVIDYEKSVSTGSSQYTWILNDLKQTTKEWIILAFHAPAYGANGGHSDNTDMQTLISNLQNENIKIDLCLSGHNHYYSRCEANGIVHLTVGGGGAPLRDPDPNYTQYVKVAVKSLSFARIEISDKILNTYVLNENGQEIDSFQISHASSTQPVAANDTYQTPFNTQLNIAAPGVLDNDSDPNSAALTAILDSTTNHGTLTLNSDGSFTYSPTQGFFGDDTFTYKAKNATEESAPATVTINVAEGKFSITGTITENGNPLANVTVTMSGDGTGTQQTDANGNYTFADLDDGSYTITPSMTGYTFNPNGLQVTLNAHNATDINFTATANSSLRFSISGTVTENGNPLANVTVTMSGDGTGTQQTDANGNYTFADLVDGSYTIIPSLTGYTFNPNGLQVTLNAHDAKDINFTGTANSSLRFSISGTITENGNPLANVTVTMAGDGTGTQQTDANGNYTFADLVDGSYTITPSMTGYTFNPNGLQVTLNAQDATGINFTGTPSSSLRYSISGTITENGNPLANVTVTMAGDGTGTQQTDASGNYTFADLVDGSYTITPSMTGYTFNPNGLQVTLNAHDATNINFTATPSSSLRYSISGTITENGNPLANVTVTMSGDGTGTQQTDASGNYTFADLVDGSYTVTPSMTGYTFSPNGLQVTLNAHDATNINFTATPSSSLRYSISGTVTENGNPLANVTLTMSGDGTGTQQTDASGNYTFANLVDGSYTITPSMTGYTFSPNGLQVTLNAHDAKDINFTATPSSSLRYSISGTVTENGNPLANVTLTMSGDGTGTQQTDASGNYTFDNLVDGSYTITPSMTGYTFSPNGLQVTLNAHDATGINFTATPSSSLRYSISGTVTENGNPLANVTLTMSGDGTGTQQTDASGNYTFANLVDGNYTITPSMTGYTFNPNGLQVTLNAHDATGINFTATQNGGGGGITDPTDIAGCNLWLDGADPKADGSAVTGALDAWKNKADTSNFAYQVDGAKQPEVVANALNGHSLLRFVGGDQFYPLVDSTLGGTSITNINTVFWVIKESATLAADTCPFFLGNSGTSVFHRGIGDANAGYAFDGKYWDNDYASDEVKNGQTYLDGAAVDGINDVFPAGDYHIVSLVLTGPVEIDSITQDRNGVYGLRSWQGDIAEIITYDSALSDTDRQSVEDYLNAKWFGSTPSTHSISGTVSGDIQAGVSVAVDATHSATTDASGNYTISGLADGTYTVTPTLTGYTFTPATANATVAGADVTGVNFTATQNAAPKFTLTVNNGTGSGQYAENDTANISATVPTGQIFDAWTGDTQYLADASAASTTVTMPAQNITVTATFKQAPPNTHSISGTISGDIQQGVVVAVNATHSATTDATGNYTISGLNDGTYTVTPTLSGYTFAPATANATISGADATGVNFTATQNAAPKFTLTVNNGTGSGQYAENDSVPISASVPNGQIFDAWTGDTQYLANSSAASTTVTMPAQNITVTATFKQAPPNSHSITGTVSGDIQQGVAVSVDLTHSATTDAAGNYTISGLNDGTYTVTPTLSGYTFTPATADATVSGADVTGVDFTATADTEPPNDNNPPIVSDDSYFVQAGQTLTVDEPSGVLANDIDPDDDALTVSVVTPLNGLNLNENGGFTYSPTLASGSVTFTYKANDGKIDSNIATVTITIIPAGGNLPPTAVGDKYTVAQDSKNFTGIENGVLANDLNASGMTVTVLSQPQNGSLTLNPDGSFEYIPVKDFFGMDSFSYSIDGTTPQSSALVALNVVSVKVTIGSMLSYNSSIVSKLGNDSFAKAPKLYGVFANGKKGSFKKVKSSTVTKFSGVWNKKFTLYNKKTVKSGYKTYYSLHGADKPEKIKVMVKGKTATKTKIDEEIQTIQLVPPVITRIEDKKGNIITSAAPGSSIVIVGEFFGTKAPKVALEANGKLLKCKVDKTALSYNDYKGKPSAMVPETGESKLTVILPSKNLTAGTYPIVLDNKIGIATTPYVDENNKGHLLEIEITK